MDLLVLYASQTGNAQDVAEQIWRESQERGYESVVQAFDDIDAAQLIVQPLLVCVVSTTGNGDFPDNMRRSWKYLLRSHLPKNLLKHTQFACLGLGDSSYEKFNFAVKKLNRRLKNLGAIEVLAPGLCDDQHALGYNLLAQEWIANLWQILDKLQTPQRSADIKAQNIFKWRIQVLENAPSTLANLDLLCQPSAHYDHFTLRVNQRTTSHDHFQDVRLLRFSTPPLLLWNPGDVLELRPCNSDEQVQAFFELAREHAWDFDEHTQVQLHATRHKMRLPTPYTLPISIGQAVKYVWDLNYKPRQRAFELLALNCDNELEKEKLLELASAAFLDDHIAYVNRPRRNILEVLQDFRNASSKLTLQILFEMLPPIQTRCFSIASAAITGTLDLLVAVVEYKTMLSKPRLGLCSNWLKMLPVGTNVLGAIKAGTLILPRDSNVPLIMIGPGTGIAPFRSFIQDRTFWYQEQDETVTPMVLFFGCRNEAKDFHFANDLRRWQNGKWLQLFVAFSRDQQQKVYVQHLIEQQGNMLTQLMRDTNAIIYVAGSSNNMPKAVKQAFMSILEADEAHMQQLCKQGRYQEETWS